MLSRLDRIDRATATRWAQSQQAGRALVGRSGAPTLAGRPSGWEPNVRYTDRRWWDQAVPLLQICPPVATASSIQTDLVLSARVAVSAENGPDEAAAEWLRRQWSIEGRPLRRYTVTRQDGTTYQRVSDPWETVLRRLMRAVHQGCGVWEWTAYLEDDGTAYLTRLHDRAMKSIHYWLEDEDENLVAVGQWVQDGLGLGKYVEIPISQLLVVTWDPQGATDYEGRGLWRAIADEAFDHSELGNTLRVGARIWAVGETVVRVDTKRAMGDGVIEGSVAEWETQQYSDAKAWAEGRYSAEGKALVCSPYWQIDRFGGNQRYDPYALVKQRVSNAEYIHQRLGTEFVLVGGTQAGGSYSAAEVKIDRAAAAAQNILDVLLAELDRQVNEPLIQANFPGLPRERYPRLEASGLRAKAYLDSLPVLVQMIQAGRMPWSAEDDAALRRDLEMRQQKPGEEPLALAANVNAPTTAADAANHGKRGAGK